MQLPIGPDPKQKSGIEVGSRIAFAHAGYTLSVDSQLKLRELYDFVEVCRAVLAEVQRDVSLSESDPENAIWVQRASEKLERFCIEADSWGFNSLYEVGLGLQMLLIDSGNRVQSDAFWDTVHRGLVMLSALLEQCEIDFRWRLAIADMLDNISQISHS